MSGGIRDITTPLPDLGPEGIPALKAWRLDRGLNGHEAAALFGMSTASYYRYEAGGLSCPRWAMVNRIVRRTGGKVRYRDLMGQFDPELA